jgi:hypothetical protein
VPEIDVDPAALVAVTRPLLTVADRLAGVAAALTRVGGDLGPADVLHALEDAAHVWQPALLDLAATAAVASEHVSSAGSVYASVEEMVSDWSGP